MKRFTLSLIELWNTLPGKDITDKYANQKSDFYEEELKWILAYLLNT